MVEDTEAAPTTPYAYRVSVAFADGVGVTMFYEHKSDAEDAASTIDRAYDGAARGLARARGRPHEAVRASHLVLSRPVIHL